MSNCAIDEHIKSYGFAQRATKGVNEMMSVLTLLNDVDDSHMPHLFLCMCVQ